MSINEFLVWHYTVALKNIISGFLTFTYFLSHYFSIRILLKTFLSPWKRETSKIKNIFPLGPFFEAVSFNLVSRFIGSVIRLITISIGLISILIFIIAGIGIILTWIIVPIFGMPFYISLTRKPSLKKLWQRAETMKEAFFTAYKTQQGSFILYRLAIKPSDLFFIMKKAPDAALPESFYSLIKFSDVFVQLAQSWMPFHQYLHTKGITPKDIYEVARWYDRNMETLIRSRKLFHPEILERTPGIGHDWTYGFTPTLDRYTSTISSSQNPLGPMYGRKKEIEEIENALSKIVQNSLLIVGEPGSGRHAIIERIADLIETGETLPVLRHKRVFKLSLDRLIGDATQEKDIDAHISAVLEEAAKAGNIILVIDQLDHFICQNSKFNITDILVQCIETGRLRIIGFSTPEKYQACFKTKSQLHNEFTVIMIEETPPEQMLRVLEDVAPIFEKQYGVYFTYQTLKEILKASHTLFPTTPFPQKGIDALGEIATRVRIHHKNQTVVCTPNDVDAVLSKISHIPYGKMKKSEKKKLQNLEILLQKRIVAQKEAINSIASALRRSRMRVKDRKKPIGSFLFLGPTGVGKTETAKALAAIYFENEKLLIRFDMSQFQTNDAIDRLIGNPKTNNPGQLVSAVSKHPFAVLLLDEFEKAAPKIQNLFLTIFDEGYLTDAYGKRVIFENMIIIATSNAGSELIREELAKGISIEKLQQQLINTILIKKLFTPELINRFDSITIYKPLTKENLKQIARLLLAQLNDRLKKEYDITLLVTGSLIDEIVAKGYNPEFGARAMRRVIYEKVEDKIAKKLLGGHVKKGQTVSI